MTIAIVGNSGSALQYNYGKLIDSYDFVIRFNDASTSGYEKHVGTKENLRFIAYHGANYNFKDKHILLYSYNEKAYREGFNKLDGENYVVRLPNEFVWDCDGLFSKPYWKWWLKQKLGMGRIIIHKKMSSTGFKAIVYGLKYLQAEIHLFGFGECDQFHYWEDTKADHYSSHSYDKEKAIIKGFEREGKLRILS